MKKQPQKNHLTLIALLDWLVEDGLVSSDRASTLKLVSDHMRDKRHPLETVAHHHWENAKRPGQVLTLDLLTPWLAKRTGMEYYQFDPLAMDVAAICGVMSYAYANRFNIIAVEVKPNDVTIATADPFMREWMHELEGILNKSIKAVFANPEDIQRYLLEFYALSKTVSKAHESQTANAGGRVTNTLEQLTALGRAGKLDANDQHIVNIVDWLLQYAYSQRASDIHLEPRRESANVRFRIDGLMHQVYQIPATVQAAVTSRIKILGSMDISEKRRPQDGRLKTRTPEGDEVELRLSTMPTAFGEKLVMRIFDPTVVVKDFAQLGFLDSELIRWQELMYQHNGIILVTGPTGSGKTTTLYTTLKEIASPEVNVCTIEDPIELIEPSFNQMQVHHQINLDFASGVRTLLRQDPDVIMVGEIRDQETAEMAIQAALTGHLVFSTLHTNDAPSTLTRLLEIGVPAYLLKATILGVLGQRLVRNICPYCRQKQPVDVDLWQSLVHPWKMAPPATVYYGKGCLECRQTGYLGRSGIYEMLCLNDAIREMISKDCDLMVLRQKAIKEGMKPLRLNGALKVAKGITTIEEVLKVAST